MNRIILIGNGFDLAHGMKTSYRDFIDDFWDKKTELFIKKYHEGNFNFRTTETHRIFDYYDNDITITNLFYNKKFVIKDEPGEKGYNRFRSVTLRIPSTQHRAFTFNNSFLEQITEKSNINSWVDIEEEYYHALSNSMENKNKTRIDLLNKEFFMLQLALEEYLKGQASSPIVINRKIHEKIYSFQLKAKNKKEYDFDSLLLLSFNYTKTDKLYHSERIDNNENKPDAAIVTFGKRPTVKIIHIHGELSEPDNPIIFGYGDEIDEKYKLLENKNDNRYLENIKSIRYSLTRNYKNLLTFIDSDYFEVLIMGHSCGISDRTLLNKIFEHSNCVSIKIFYHVKDDGTDNYMDLYKNISRNFINKSLQRERVVNKKDCEPLT
jgi:hypothetical protein